VDSGYVRTEGKAGHIGATLKDVAARAGVSIKTVSNVVNERPYVTDDTRERVRAALDALRYRPNLSARHLRTGRLGVLALAIPDLGNTYFADIGKTVGAAAAAHGYTVLLDHTGGDRASELLAINGLRPHLIDGVLLSPLALEMDDLRPDVVATPLVLLGERLFGAPYDHVAPDNVAAARVATTHLIALGRRRIAAIGVQDTDSGATGRLRLRGYLDALQEAGRAVDPALLASVASFHRADGAQAMRRLLALDDPPDAVFCFNDLLALGAIRALHDAGLSVPTDVAVVGYDDIEEGIFATPSLTTIAPDKEEIGRVAVSMLVARIEGDRRDAPARIETPFRLIVRESTAGFGSRESGVGSRESGVGSRESGVGSNCLIGRASDFTAPAQGGGYHRLSTFDFRLSTFDFRLSTFDFRLSTFDFRLSTFDRAIARRADMLVINR